jgi:hypothetical protein
MLKKALMTPSMATKLRIPGRILPLSQLLKGRMLLMNWRKEIQLVLSERIGGCR